MNILVLQHSCDFTESCAGNYNQIKAIFCVPKQAVSSFNVCKAAFESNVYLQNSIMLPIAG